jgi:hypothetical protein
MRAGRSLAVGALVGATAVGLAGPAHAESLVSGTYVVALEGFSRYISAPSLWSVERCGADCARLSDGRGTVWDAKLANGRWTATRHSDDAVDCRNGFFAPGTSVFSVDETTLKGAIVSTSDGPACGSPAQITNPPVRVTMSYS